VTEDELPVIRKAWEAVRDIIPDIHREEGDGKGLFVEDEDELTIRCYDNRACIFVMYEGDVAVCSIQKLHQEGRFHWPKPLSCHLFPIRVRGKKREQLHYERFSECTPALEAGRRDDIGLVEFLEVPLRRAFGDAFYVGLHERSMSGRENGDEGR
jgi:hypothetical protein